MATEVKMPQLSDTMHSGKILAWKKAEGDKIARGDILAEVETEKANLEIESFTQGVLLKILTPSQSTANVGDTIAVIGQPGEAVGASSSAPAAAAPTPKLATNGHTGNSRPAISQPAQQQSIQSKAVQTAPARTPSSSSDRIKVSPLARKIAEQNRVDLSMIQGSGPDGRIVRKDVEDQRSSSSFSSASAAGSAPMSARSPQPTSAPVAPSAIPAGGRLTPLSKMRDLIARRMQESVTQSPHFYTTVRINMTQTKRFAAALKAREDFKGVGLNHIIIKAAAYALEREPRVNAAMKDGMLYEPEGINIGIITAIDDGLLIPVVKDANRLSLRDLAFEARAAIDRARAGRPSSSDLTGGTFSISNMGMFDVENFTAIINPGQGAVLAVSSIHQEPIVQDSQVVIGEMMKATLSVDHRIIDGIMAAQFLKAFKDALELPALLSL